MTLRVGIGGIFHETNTFAEPTGIASFDIMREQEIIDFGRGARTYLGGLMDESNRQGFDVVPLFYAEATPSGIIQYDAYAAMRDELVERVGASDLDALLLSLHGAGVAETVDSIEEDICSALRARMGQKFTIVATLDLHGNIRQELGNLCQGLFPVRFNPHTDQHERGVEAAKCLADIVFGKIEFDTAIESVPMLFPPVPTSLPVFEDLDRICNNLEQDRAVACARIMHGFPYADVPHMGASVVVVTRKAQADARSIAKTVAAALWKSRDHIKVDCLDATSAVEAALGHRRSMVVINEFSDNTGAGTPGDGTHLLSALIRAGARACFSHIHDPAAVRKASAAGVGARISLELGGRSDPLLGEPIAAEAEVLGLNQGLLSVKSPMGTGERIDLGPLATLRVGSVDVVVSSGRRQTLDDGWFIKAGIDIAQFPIVALKSSQHFRAWFEGRADRIITADPPGLSPVDVSRLQRQRLRRPLWPICPRAVYPEKQKQVSA